MTDQRFEPSSADGRWQRAWEEARCFEADSASAKPKSYYYANGWFNGCRSGVFKTCSERKTSFWKLSSFWEIMENRGKRQYYDFIFR